MGVWCHHPERCPKSSLKPQDASLGGSQNWPRDQHIWAATPLDLNVVGLVNHSVIVSSEIICTIMA